MKWSKQEIIKYRATKSLETLNEAKILIAGGGWRGAANRLYYSAFQMVSALMAQEDIRIKSHSGAKHMLDLHFFRIGKLPAELSKLYSRLYKARQESDYDDFIYYSEEDVLPLLEETEQFVITVRQLLNY